MRTNSPTVAKQRGMAVISALLIAAVVAVIAGGMLTRQTLFTRSLEAEQLRIQGTARLQGGLQLSRQLLSDARQRDPLTRFGQPWANPIVMPGSNLVDTPFEGQLEDEQGKFNLRNLVANERVDQEQVRAFERLCDQLGVAATVRARIVERVIAAYPRVLNPELADKAPVSNSFDSGRDTSPDASNAPLAPTRPMLRTLQDLRGVKGVTEALLETLAPYVTILPTNTWLNGNTASASVLAAYVPGLSLQRAQALVRERDGGHWFINRGDFVNRLRMPELEMTSVKVGITSDWFRLRGQARSGQRRVEIDALLQRSQDRLPQVIWSRVGV
ncbi:UNVERIFIED_ORG: general secretion pathway protein K [Pseudomonas lini]|uniref:Type II secretion system protein K n=1 Tax=Pseudomonas viciae TaxID=2505979 RepID=A0A4P7PG41_9PSED|nr:type II secretion system minor pseudopilin GspK [Pseudomonas viciae]QBZ89566.1 general secretion pathway protein GspK [Pseudomonas viciae]UZE89030.1 type II secretion system minor pseudopilin GspK [Pseudomonas viciae]WGO95843.1 type II secretion system minor pseudopilin GspK [Pseudomonas viciae]